MRNVGLRLPQLMPRPSSDVPGGMFNDFGAPVTYTTEYSALSWACPPRSPCKCRRETSVPVLPSMEHAAFQGVTAKHQLAVPADISTVSHSVAFVFEVPSAL